MGEDSCVHPMIEESFIYFLYFPIGVCFINDDRNMHFH